MIILGIDPGGTTGLAQIRFDPETKKLSLQGIQESKDESCLEWLPLIEESDVVVYENFLVRPGVARKGHFDFDDMVAPRVIGSLTTLAKLNGKKLVKQEPSIKPVGYGFSNQKYVKGKKGMHTQDAVAHAVYYAVKNLKALPLGRR